MPPKSLSMPPWPSRTSLPSPPRSSSLPGPPTRRLAAGEPVILSWPAPTTTFSTSPLTLSVSAGRGGREHGCAIIRKIVERDDEVRSRLTIVSSVDAGVAVEDVSTRTADHAVVPVAAVEDIVPAVATELIVAAGAIEIVIAGAAV